MSEYRQFVESGLRQGYTLKQIGTSWRAANHGRPSPEGQKRDHRNSIITRELRAGKTFAEARRLAEQEHAMTNPGKAARAGRARGAAYFRADDLHRTAEVREQKRSRPAEYAENRHYKRRGLKRKNPRFSLDVDNVILYLGLGAGAIFIEKKTSFFSNAFASLTSHLTGGSSSSSPA